MEKEIEINEEDIARLMRGERPQDMDYEEFRLKRKALQRFLKKRSRGNVKVQDTV